MLAASNVIQIFRTLLLYHIAFSLGDRSFTLVDGRSGYCRSLDDCPPSSVYQGVDCLCDTDICCLDSGISRAKCDEYSQYVYSEDYGDALMSRRSLAKVSYCRNEVVPLIVGGVPAAAMEFPHMVAIGYGELGNVKYMCGGSLISEQHVLSAAHCSESLNDGPAQWAKLGALSLIETDEESQDMKIVERVVHPRYKPPLRYHDIAIFKLEKLVRMSGYVRPACLQANPDLSVTSATATGWGKVDYADRNGSSVLMKVQLNIVVGEPCNKTYRVDASPGRSLPLGILKSQFCAGDPSGNKDTCQGDSGGPLQVTLASPFCMYAVLGITSFGKFCGLAPAIYTRVARYVPWIESVVWP